MLGATGQQGGSVVSHLLSSGLYRVRGVTRDPSSAASVSLKKRGVEVVSAEADSVAQLTAAFQGAYGVFGVTNFWDPAMAQDADKETQQGRNIADAAVKANVRVIVWSSLHDAEAAIRQRESGSVISGSSGSASGSGSAGAGASGSTAATKPSTSTTPTTTATTTPTSWDAHHFTSKHRVERYIRTLPGITAVFVYAGFYVNNFAAFPPFAPTRLSPTTVEWALPLRSDVGLPLFDVADTGLYVLSALQQPDKYSGQRLLMATDYLTTAQIAAAYQRVTGEQATSRTVPIDAQYPDSIQTSYRWFNEHGYYNGEAITHTSELPVDKLTSWEQYLKQSKWRVA